VKEKGNETPPSNIDHDQDGLLNNEEIFFNTDPNDADSDDDGILDGDEGLNTYNLEDPVNDPDNDGWNNAMDADADGDGILDGTERGITDNDIDFNATDLYKMRFFADQDPNTTTDPLKMDSDNDTWSDGDEDRNANGKYEPALDEMDPNFKDYDDDGIHDDSDPDDDNDGIPDTFEKLYSNALNPLDKSDADDDFDRDGVTNYREYLGNDNVAGNSDWSDPEDPSSFPTKGSKPDLDKDSDDIPDDLDAFPEDETQWSDKDGDGFGDNPDGNAPDAFPNDPTEWSDTDRDGIGDNSDAAPNDPTNREKIVKDTDGDGLPDSWELTYGLDMNNIFDAKSDHDNDSLTNLEEYRIGTHPRKFDTDGDGYSDKVDDFPTDSTQYKIKNSKDPEGTNYIVAFSAIIIVIIFLAVLNIIMVLRKKKHRTSESKEPSSSPEDQMYTYLMYEVIEKNKDAELSDEELKINLEKKYQAGEMSAETYDYMKKFIGEENR
jgi:hypothetical protein